MVLRRTFAGPRGRVAGCDASIDKARGLIIAAVVILRFPEFELVEERSYQADLDFPYIPGLLSFREGPALVECFRKVDNVPDAVLVDGQGLAHPRRLGLASHLGLWLKVPTVGCAKSRLIGQHDEPARERGSWTKLVDKGESIGAVLRTRTGVKPLFISPGHLTDIASSVGLVLQCGRGLRLPEPSRLAHNTVTRLRKKLG